jgi:hypothetical protein
MIPRFDYDGLCWWCSNIAQTQEHKYKKSDLIREFGSGEYSGDRALVRVITGDQRQIRGPKSQEVKFQKNMCAPCNNHRSQNFDLSYDLFAEYLRKKEKFIYQSGKIDLLEVYGQNWKEKSYDLLRYFVKHICCRLAEANVYIAQEIIDFLDGNDELPYILFTFEIREDIYALTLHPTDPVGGLWLGDMNCMKSQSTGLLSKISSHYGYRWFRVNYEYDANYACSIKSVIGQILHLCRGRFYSPDEVLEWHSKDSDNT